MANDRETGGAGLYVRLPAWVAVTVHDPAPVIVTVPLATEHWPVAENTTGSAELETARTSNGASPYVRSVNASNAIAWSLDSLTVAGATCRALPVSTEARRP